MGAGKGKTRRVNTANNPYMHILKIPKPKFNLGDKVLIDSRTELITEILYIRNEEEKSYQYKFKNQESLPAIWHDESELTLVGHSTPDDQAKDFWDYLHKVVTFKYHPDHWDEWDTYGVDFEISSLDNHQARIIGVHNITDRFEFTLRFNGVDQQTDQELRGFYFSEENFKPKSRMKALNPAELDGLPAF